MSDQPSGGAPAEGGSQPQATESPGTTQEPKSPPSEPKKSEGKPDGDQSSETKADKQTGIRLPGVVSKNDGNDLIPDIPRRGPDGKFQSREDRAKALEKEMEDERKAFFPPDPPADDKKTVPEPPPGSEKKTDSQAPEKFSFAGEEYESREKAEQSIKSLKGMFKPLTQERDSERQRADEAVDSAIKWREYALHLEQGGKPNSPAPQDPQAPAGDQKVAGVDLAKILQNVDGNMFEKIAQDPDKGLPIAGRYLAASVLDAVVNELLPQYRQQILDEVNKGIDPIREQQAFNDAAESVKDMFVSARGLRLNDGSQAFPELNDPETAFRIAEVWRNLELPAEVAMSPKGLMQAIATYRLYHGAPQPKAPEPTPEPKSTPAVPHAAGASDSGGSGVIPGAGKANPDDLFSRALDETELVDPNLGFAVRRRR